MEYEGNNFIIDPQGLKNLNSNKINFDITSGDENIDHPKPDMGGEDFAYYLQKIPGAYYFFGASNVKKGIKQKTTLQPLL